MFNSQKGFVYAVLLYIKLSKKALLVIAALELLFVILSTLYLIRGADIYGITLNSSDMYLSLTKGSLTNIPIAWLGLMLSITLLTSSILNSMPSSFCQLVQVHLKNRKNYIVLLAISTAFKVLLAQSMLCMLVVCCSLIVGLPVIGQSQNLAYIFYGIHDPKLQPILSIHIFELFLLLTEGCFCLSFLLDVIALYLGRTIAVLSLTGFIIAQFMGFVPHSVMHPLMAMYYIDKSSLQMSAQSAIIMYASIALILCIGSYMLVNFFPFNTKARR